MIVLYINQGPMRIRAKITGNGKHKYFGTDGFRGEANTDLSAEQAFKIGRFLGWYMEIYSGCRDRHYRPA